MPRLPGNTGGGSGVGDVMQYATQRFHRRSTAALGLAGVLALASGLAAFPASGTAVDPTTSEGAGSMKRDKPLALGELMPDFVLQNESGEKTRLSEALEGGPVVMTFYRGTWCPYCVKALESIETSVSQINDLGATVLAISPQTPENIIDLREQTGLSYELLVDKDNGLAERLGLMFELDEKTVELYRQYGIDVAKTNGTDTWQLPVPATYVVDTDGKVRYAWTDADYRKRAPVSKILASLRLIRGED